jgi:serine/threonine protein kinase
MEHTDSVQSFPNTMQYPVVKLIDFGFANTWKEGDILKTPCGSLAYSAPEVLLGETVLLLSFSKILRPRFQSVFHESIHAFYEEGAKDMTQMEFSNQRTTRHDVHSISIKHANIQ